MGVITEFESKVSAKRLDKYLASLLMDLSRSQLQQLIEAGHVTVDGVSARSSMGIRVGQRISVLVPDPPSEYLVPGSGSLEIVYENQEVFVINKPAGLVVHPSSTHKFQTLANILLTYYPTLQNVGGPLRSGIVHRLDKNTSGLMIVAKNNNAHAYFSKQFKERKVEKMYLALTRGNINPDEAIIDAPIGRHPRNRKKMAPVDSGKEASTRYRVITQFKNFSLVEVKPTTGRTHQIRVHLASIGHPVAGDVTYGSRHPGLDRHFLHAYTLGFNQLLTGQRINLRSDLPGELQLFLDSLD